MMKPRGLLFIGLLLICARPALADPISFETGPSSLAEWETAGAVGVRGTVSLPWFGNPPQIIPSDGSYQAVLSSGHLTDDVGANPTFALTAESMEVFFFGQANGAFTSQGYVLGSGMKRNFTLAAGDKLTFDWNFVAFDALPYNDAALFITDGAGSLLSSVALVGDYNRSGWVLGNTTAIPCTPILSGCFEATTAGTYSIGVGVFDHTAEGPDNSSFLAVDNFNVTQASGEAPPPVSVPEPGTLLMLMGGFAAVLTAKRSRVN